MAKPKGNGIVEEVGEKCRVIIRQGFQGVYSGAFKRTAASYGSFMGSATSPYTNQEPNPPSYAKSPKTIGPKSKGKRAS